MSSGHFYAAPPPPSTTHHTIRHVADAVVAFTSGEGNSRGIPAGFALHVLSDKEAPPEFISKCTAGFMGTTIYRGADGFERYVADVPEKDGFFLLAFSLNRCLSERDIAEFQQKRTMVYYNLEKCRTQPCYLYDHRVVDFNYHDGTVWDRAFLWRRFRIGSFEVESPFGPPMQYGPLNLPPFASTRQISSEVLPGGSSVWTPLADRGFQENNYGYRRYVDTTGRRILFDTAAHEVDQKQHGDSNNNLVVCYPGIRPLDTQGADPLALGYAVDLRESEVFALTLRAWGMRDRGSITDPRLDNKTVGYFLTAARRPGPDEPPTVVWTFQAGSFYCQPGPPFRTA